MTNNTHAETSGLLSTDRTDKWWVEPLWTGLGFLCFVIYTTWAMFQANNYWWSNGQAGRAHLNRVGFFRFCNLYNLGYVPG